MRQNVRENERLVRGVLAAILLGAGLTAGRRRWWGLLAEVVAALLLLSATTGFCHVYKTLGLCSLSARE